MELGDFWVCYINLDSRSDRRKHIEAELKSVDLKWSRISATTPMQIRESVRNSSANLNVLACTHSHLVALQTFIRTDHNHALILEDDFHWIKIPDEELLQMVVKFDLVSTGSVAREHSNNKLAEVINDLLWKVRKFLPGVGLTLQRWLYPIFVAKQTLSSKIANQFGAGTHGYFISKTGAIKVIDILENNIDPIDQIFNSPIIQLEMSVGRIEPPIGSQIPSYSDIRER